MRPTLYTCMLLLCVAVVYFNGCQTTDDDNQLGDLEQADTGNIAQDSSWDEKNQASQENVSGMTHPKEATAWFTRKLIMTSRQPSPDSISRCQERVESNSSQAQNLRSLEDVAAGLENVTAESPKVYHWCFYQMMSDLDNRLAGDSSLMDEKANIFLARMKSLWVLARALDATSNSKTYMKYLRSRYTDISQNVFGRNLELMDAQAFRLPVKESGKGAATYSD